MKTAAQEAFKEWWADNANGFKRDAAALPETAAWEVFRAGWHCSHSTEVERASDDRWSTPRKCWQDGLEAAAHYIENSTFGERGIGVVRSCAALIRSLKDNSHFGPRGTTRAESPQATTPAPDNWKPLPPEPTRSMLDAWTEVSRGVYDNRPSKLWKGLHYSDSEARMVESYRAMLEAAPKPSLPSPQTPPPDA